MIKKISKRNLNSLLIPVWLFCFWSLSVNAEIYIATAEVFTSE